MSSSLQPTFPERRLECTLNRTERAFCNVLTVMHRNDRLILADPDGQMGPNLTNFFDSKAPEDSSKFPRRHDNSMDLSTASVKCLLTLFGFWARVGAFNVFAAAGLAIVRPR
jgi:hypothetical protein